MTTNVTPSNPFRNFMESFMEWHLICRNHEQMVALKPDAAPESSCDVPYRNHWVNIFLEVRKPK